MAEDLFAVLGRFHREIALPQIEASIDGNLSRLRGEFLTHFDAIYSRFDRLELQYQALTAAVARLESESQIVSGAIARLESESRSVAAALARIEARN